MLNILGREGLYRRTTDIFYVAVVQAVLLFGLYMWVVTPRVEKSLAGFHHRAARHMASMGPKRQLDGTWVYPLIGVTLAMLGLDETGVCIACRQKMDTP